MYMSTRTPCAGSVLSRERCLATFYNATLHIQGDRKVMQLDTCSICQKINYIQIRKQTTMCWKCPPRSAMHAFTLFIMFYVTR
jgi:hypothetical protein